MSVSETKRAAGQEVLVVDGDVTVLRGLERLLAEGGLTVTTLTDPDRARDQVVNRFIPVVLCDLDTPRPMAGIELLKFIRHNSPLTAVLVMTSRQGYDAVAPGFRAGAFDVVPKIPAAIDYLRERVVAAALEIRATQTREQLLAEVGEVHEEFLHKMMELSRQVTDLEDKLLSRQSEVDATFSGLSMLDILLVDDEPALSEALQRDLPDSGGWRVRYAQSGGEALDSAGQRPPHVVVAKESLPDLPGSMVVKTVKASLPDVVAILFTPPGEESAGQVRMVESSRLHTLIPSFSDPRQLVASLHEVREALKKKARERRYLQTFRNQNLEFLKKYSAIKQRLAHKP